MQTAFMKARASLETRGRFAHGALPEPIANSWHRCLKSGLDPLGDPVDAVVSYQDLRLSLEKNEQLLAVVRPELELLSNQIAGTNFMTAFADRDGVVLDAIMDSEFRDSECSKSIRTGSVWREELRGTNALGLALHTGETCMVTGSEHFFSTHGAVSCVSSPIFNSRGQIVGLLDASSEVRARQFHTRALVSLAATNIENRLFVDEHRGDNIIQFHPREEYLTTQNVGMLSVDEDGRITGVNRHAGRILSGLDLSASKAFTDLFRGGFGASMSAMARGEIIRLVDWLNAAYFARIRITRPPASGRGARRSVALNIPAVYNLPSTPDAPVYRDAQVHNALRIAVRSARMGTPFSILGDPGTGRTTLAQSVHDAVHKTRPLFAVDCQTANDPERADRLMADIFGGTDDAGFSLETGGTLVLDNLGAAEGGAAEKLAQITNRMIQRRTGKSWLVIAIGGPDLRPDPRPDGKWPAHVSMAFSRLTALKTHLPRLSERTDFAQVAISVLAGISPGHQLSNSAIEALRRHDFPQNLSDLATRLRALAVQCPIGIIREENVERHLGRPDLHERACPRCAGNAVREVKCRKIKRVFRECNANVALAARTLGVSRNTVYFHTAS